MVISSHRYAYGPYTRLEHEYYMNHVNLFRDAIAQLVCVLNLTNGRYLFASLWVRPRLQPFNQIKQSLLSWCYRSPPHSSALYMLWVCRSTLHCSLVPSHPGCSIQLKLYTPLIKAYLAGRSVTSTVLASALQTSCGGDFLISRHNTSILETITSTI